MPIIIALVIILAGGASIGAQNSLPGDALYPVKVNINEKVQTIFAARAETSGNIHLNHALKRLEEAERLALDARLDDSGEAAAEAAFENKVNKVRSKIEQLRADGNLTAAAALQSNLQAALVAHERIIMGLESGPRNSLSALLNRVKVERMQIDTDLADVNGRIIASAGAASAAQGKMTAAENKLAEVRKFFDRKSDSASTTLEVQADVALRSAETIFADAKAKLDAGAYAEAFSLFQNAIGTAQEAKILLTQSTSVRSSMDLNATTTAANTRDHGNATSTNATSTRGNATSTDAKQRNSTSTPRNNQGVQATTSINVEGSNVNGDIEVRVSI